jgi:uncharacterized Zn-finger protein
VIEMKKEINRCPRSPDGKHYLVLVPKKGIIICEYCGERFHVIIERD